MSTTLPSARRECRVLIVEDHVLFGESLQLALDLESYDVRRVELGAHASGAALVNAVLRARPRIVLLDLDLGSFGDGVPLIAGLARGGANVVVVTASTDRARWGECVRHGARKVLSKSRPLAEVLSVVRRLHHAQQVMDVVEREALLQAWAERRAHQEQVRHRFDLLTARERQVLGALMAGRLVRDVARDSVVSEATVRTQVKSILAKLEVSSQIAAVGLAHDVQWRPPLD